MKYALIGCGRISGNHIEAARVNSLEIVALCDVIPGKASENIDKYSLNAAAYTDYKKMLSERMPELVAIATDSGLHAQIALDCIAAGCNVIIEKPIALSLEDADKIIEASERAGVVVSACHQNRFNNSIQRIRRALEGGHFGKLYYGVTDIRWARGDDYYGQAAWRGTWAMDGGTLMNQCIHNIDLLRWMMGDDIVSVTGMTDRLKHPSIEAEDFGMAMIRFANGSYGIIDGTTNIYKEDFEGSLSIFGEKGFAKAGGTASNVIEKWEFADGLGVGDGTDEYSDSVYGFGHAKLYADVIAAIKDGRAPYVGAKEGRSALEAVLAIYKSASMGGAPVTLPLESGSTEEFRRDFR